MAVYITEGLLDKIKEKKKKKEEEKKAKQEAALYEDAKDLVKRTAEWAKSPKTLGDGYDSEILYIYGKAKSLEGLCQFCAKNKNKFSKVDILHDWCQNDTALFNKYKRLLGDKPSEVQFNDDYSCCLGLNGKLYSVYIVDDEINLATLSDFTSYDFSVSMLRKADKELGTNLFS